jgi:hypothetical protein
MEEIGMTVETSVVNQEEIIRRLERLEAVTTSSTEESRNESIEPAYGLASAKFLETSAFDALAQSVVEISAQDAMVEGPSLVAANKIVSIAAADLGHTPDGRGRRTGPSDSYWRDYCNTTR